MILDIASTLLCALHGFFDGIIDGIYGGQVRPLSTSGARLFF